MASHDHHSKQVKAAVIAALMVGERVDDVARAHNVPLKTVYRWHKTISHEDMRKIENKNAAVGELLLNYLTETLITLTEQARFFRNESWLSKQSAADVAIVHGVAADKAFRLLEAIERANQSQPAPAQLVP